MTTQDNETGSNQVDRQQESLEAEAAQAQPTLEEMVRAQVLQMQKLTGLVQEGVRASRSAQGLASKSADAVRRDLMQEIETLKQGRRDEDLLSEVPEEHKPWAARVLQEARSRAQGQATPGGAQPEVSQQDTWVNAVREDVTAMGANPDDPRINWGALLQGDRNTWLKSVGDTLRPQESQAQPQPQRSQRQPGPNPPVDRGPSTGGPTNIDQLRDLYITGRMPKDDYVAKARAMGVEV